MNNSWTTVVQAASLAAKLHDGQVRKDGTPYFQHPARVASILARACSKDNLIAAGFLHDVIEDTPADYDDISQLFGARRFGPGVAEGHELLLNGRGFH